MYLSQRNYPEGDVRSQRHHRNFMLDRPDIFMCIIIAWLSCFMFLRTAYNDTGNYIFEWRRATPSLEEFLDSGELFKFGSNPLFKLYKSVLKEFTDSYHVMFFFPAVLSCVASIKLIKRFSVDPVFSLMVFFSVGTYVLYMAAVKQCFAIAILLYALPYALDKKYIRFVLLVLFAVMFHTHAFIFLAVPFFFGRPWGKLTWCLLLAVLVAIATYNRTFSALMEFALSIGVNIADIEVFDGHSINPLRILVYSIPAIMSFFFRDRLYYNSTRAENLFANLSIVAAFILSIGLIQGANLFARMAAYYEIALSLSFPWMINKVFDRPSAKLIKTVAYPMFFVYFLYEFGISKSFDIAYRSITLWQFFQEVFQ